MLVKFGNCGSLEQHGFARNKIWTIDENPPPLNPNDSHGKSFIDLLLKPSEEDLKCWPHRYELGSLHPLLILLKKRKYVMLLRGWYLQVETTHCILLSRI